MGGENAGSDVVVSMEFEHRKKDGTLVSKGYQEVDHESGEVHSIQEDARGNIFEAIIDRLGRRRVKTRRV